LEPGHDAHFAGVALGRSCQCVDQSPDDAAMMSGKDPWCYEDQAVMRRIVLAAPRRFDAYEITDVLAHDASLVELGGDKHFTIGEPPQGR
jgi:hypothetical protein